MTLFTGVDGEGVTDKVTGIHDYVLLSIRSTSLHDNGANLPWKTLFQFLHTYGTAFPDEILVGFYLNYDFTEWCKTMPEDRAKMLFTPAGRLARTPKARGGNTIPFPMDLLDDEGVRWECDVLPKRRFKLRPQGEPWVYICDTGPFWQSSLMKAIDPAAWPEPVCYPEEYETIKEGKAERADAVFDPAMIRYNVTENRVLSRMTGELDKAFRKAGVKLKRTQWFGPGQVAQSWMKQLSVLPTFEVLREIIPDDAWNAILSTYYGGWFEIMAHGHIGEAYEYDINSAYPYAIGMLPCLLHGRWENGNGPHFPISQYTIIRATVVGSDPHVGAMPHRTSEGRILRPHTTGGHYWLSEIEAAQAAGLIDRVEVAAWWTYHPCECPPPLRDIYELYNQRLAVGKNSPEGKALKLIYNSIYGKTAQTVGKPQWSNPFYASRITSVCRIMILEAIATHPARTSAVVMVATDGIYFQSPHRTLPLSASRIGGWDEQRLTGLTLFQPGLYWTDKARSAIARGDRPNLKSRGISTNHLAPHLERIDSQFHSFDADNDPWPTFEIPIPFTLVTAELALTRGKWNTAGTVRTDLTRSVSSTPVEKRNTHALTTHDGILRSQPHRWPRWDDPFSPYEESHRYDKLAGYRHELGDDEELTTPDGDALLTFTELME